MPSSLHTPEMFPAALKKRGGFTLVELMIVVVIVGVLAAIAVPSYSSYMMKSRRSDAFTALTAVSQAQERWRSNNPSYANSLSTLFPAAASPASSPNGHYVLTLTANDNGATQYSVGYQITATPASGDSQAGDTDCATIYIQARGGNLIYSSPTSVPTAGKCWPQ